ncbi:coiled-coil domain-containing protein 150-like [Sinocyclocheilus grahami]|uniref:coiled-coil domain-containing protein 150-like n=1 Tax=Sinocyclocheilus grahami TaxID=75366 RepID=UPI0007AD446B|nr:PREDICTED: coiled-coil domain-containing protein 150-like [Sinocyclocheilus grahami]
MSRSVICSLSVGATAPESLSVLQRRLQTAEQQTEELVRSLGSLGASADQLLVNSSDGSSSKHPISPVNIHRALSAAGECLLWRRILNHVEVLQADCHALRTDRQANRAELKKREEQILGLERECRELRDQSGVKETLISQLTKEIKSVKMALQKQQQENSRLIRDGRDLRAAADQVQVLNEELEVQCSELSTALHSLTLENTRLQTEHHCKIKAERDRVFKHLQEQDLLLDTARRNIQAELQGTISEKLTLQKELEALKADHGKLQQSSTVALETAVNHQQMLERTVQRLQGELSCAVKDDQIKSEMNSAVISLEKEKNILETQLSEIKVELTMVNSALQKPKKENKELMESLAALKHQQVTHRQVEQMLWDLTDSKNKLAYEKGKMQTRVQQMAADLKTLKAECTQYCHSNTALQNTYTQAQRENQTLKEQLFTLQQQHRDTNEVAQTLENVLSSHTRLQQNTQTLHAELRERAQELHTLRRERCSQSLLQLHSEMLSLQSELQCLSSTQQGELQAERDLNHTLQEKCRHLEESLKSLSSLSSPGREVRLGEVCLESQQITENMDEDHRGLCSKSESFNGQTEPQKLTESLCRTGKDTARSTPAQTRVCFFDPELEPWASALQRWEMKKELGHIAGIYKPTRHVRALTT